MRSPQQTKGAEEEGEKKPGRVVAMILKIPVVGKMYKLYFETISKLSIVIVFYAFLKYLALLLSGIKFFIPPMPFHGLQFLVFVVRFFLWDS